MGKFKPKNKISPPNFKWSRVRTVIAWMVVFLMIVSLIRSFSISAQDGTAQELTKDNKQEENAAVSVGAQTFAKNFIKDYFTWDIGDQDAHAERLTQYLRSGVDEHAGLRFDGLKSSSIPGEVEVINVKETGKNTSLITIHATHYLETEVKKDDKTETKKDGPFDEYIKVPIITNGSGYLVNDIPTYTSEPAKPDIKEKKQEHRATVDSDTKASIEKYLPTFFKVYSTGSSQELSYYINDLKIKPLNGILVFDNVETFQAYKTDGESIDIEANVVFKDKESNAPILQKYTLNIVQKDGRWIVNKIN